MTSFRGFPCCSCLKKWLPVLESELLRRGLIKYQIDIYQLTGKSTLSAGTHSQGGAADLGQWTRAQLQVIRDMGADAGWHRGAPFFANHVHLVLRGCQHNAPARYQIWAVDRDYNGLGRGGMGGRDNGPRPLSYRTYKQGIAWAKNNQKIAKKEDDMPISGYHPIKRSTPQVLPKGKWVWLYTDDKKNLSFEFGKQIVDEKLYVNLGNLPAGTEVIARFVRSEVKRGKKTRNVAGFSSEVIGTSGGSMQTVCDSTNMGKYSRLRVQLYSTADGVTVDSAAVKTLSWK